MRKMVLTSTLAILGLGLNNAGALEAHSGYNASDDFGFSEQNDLPAPRFDRQLGGSDVGVITSSTGVDKVTAGYPARARFGSTERVYRGYNASDDFAPSSQNDLPAPRFKQVR